MVLLQVYSRKQTMTQPTGVEEWTIKCMVHCQDTKGMPVRIARLPTVTVFACMGNCGPYRG